MDDLIEKLEYLTEEFLKKINVCSYEDVEVFISDREEFVNQILLEFNITSYTDSQKLRILNVIKLDTAIEGKINSLLIEAQDFLVKRTQAVKQRDAYEVSRPLDSIIMDRRK